ncbi:cytochrome P450 3A24 [Podospora aff. communis PSN243]|uniref:Cytochrome P450 3A24 n=1 Tax=Podospora aff. communis PSN243 TaxID=3040156 RepID=A0AAV9GH92_9PEZI|nr:cytochrome P450 3A24 [Podospora aff. communis PSN243]
MATTYTLVIFGIIGLGIAWLYRRLLPTILPNGIPYDHSSAYRPFGDGFAVKAEGKRTLETSIAMFSQCQKLGSPIVQFLLTSLPGTNPAVVLDDPREVEDILLRRNREFDRSTLTTELFDKILPTSTIAQVTTPHLKAQKRLWSDVMSPEFLRRVVAPNLQMAAKELVELWKVKSEGDDEPIEVSEDVQCTALDAIWVAVLGNKIGVVKHLISKARGEKVDEETARVTELVRFAAEEAGHIVGEGVGSVWPALTFFFASWKPSFRRFRRVGREEVQKLMSNACERFHRLSEMSTMSTDDEEHDTCAMDFVLRREIMRAKKEGRPAPDPPNDPTMLDELWLLLLAGHDSTANTLGWFVKIMGLHPVAQRELREALVAAFGDNKFPNSTEILKAEIPLLDATIEETNRFSATAAITSRRAVVDTQILGYHIPKGTDVLMNLRTNKQQFDVDESLRSETCRAAQAKRPRGGFDGPSGRDLDKFVPRRWLAQDATGKEVFDAYSLPVLNFGGGFRGCFGKRLAYLELRIIITTLVLNFEFLPLPEKLTGMEAYEEVFRKPRAAHVKLRAL